MEVNESLMKRERLRCHFISVLVEDGCLNTRNSAGSHSGTGVGEFDPLSRTRNEKRPKHHSPLGHSVSIIFEVSLYLMC